MLAPETIYTIGHSNTSLAKLMGLLTAHGISTVADVRSYPRSRRHPHFGGEQLQATIIAEGIERKEELETLLELGVGYGQGFLLGRPAGSFLPPATLTVAAPAAG